MSLNYSGFQNRPNLLLWRQISRHHHFIMFPVPKMASHLCAAVALASGLTLSSLAPHTLLPPLPLGALAPALLASALNLTLMQSERPLALLRHPHSAPSVFGLQSTAFAFHLLGFRLRASPPPPHPPNAPPARPSAPSFSYDVAAGVLDSELQLMWFGEPCEVRYNT